ncbi:hypothetical protein K0651_09810 [Ornithinimicrobium sp. Arc0846-15]|nr:hypothetical protein [Ornithinimicrobium laminariae]
MSKTSIAVGSLVAAILGAATWMIWCGFDTTYYPEGTGGPYTTWQVVCCGITFAVLAVGFAYRYSSRKSPFFGSAITGIALALGFWLAWTIQAGMTDETGLFLVGAMMLGTGLTLSTFICVAVGVALSQLVLRREKATSDKVEPSAG